MRTVVVFLFAAAMSVAGAAERFNVMLFQESIVNGTSLKPGQYRVTVDGTKATIERGKESVEAEVKVEAVESKFKSTSVRYLNGDGKYRVSEIRLGGTAKKLVFDN
ncbi:MAG: hypothetical protein R2762_30710 [Bryobacteraceae bacterium]